MIVLTRTDDDRNMRRFYALDVAPTLFGEWALITEWGRVMPKACGARRLVRHGSAPHFADEASASAARTTRIAIKQRRGYQSKGTEGNCPGP